jgi:replicative superfamily II helicase
VSRKWKSRKGFEGIGLFVVDGLHLLSENYSIMEVVVSRMRYVASQLGNDAFKMIGLSASIANYLDIGEWIGAPA